MKNAPCAKLTMRMMPKISVKPDAEEEQQCRLRQRIQALGDQETEEVHQLLRGNTNRPSVGERDTRPAVLSYRRSSVGRPA